MLIFVLSLTLRINTMYETLDELVVKAEDLADNQQIIRDRWRYNVGASMRDDLYRLPCPSYGMAFALTCAAFFLIQHNIILALINFLTINHFLVD